MNSVVRTCPQCGRNIEPDWKTCVDCGAELITEVSISMLVISSIVASFVFAFLYILLMNLISPFYYTNEAGPPLACSVNWLLPLLSGGAGVFFYSKIGLIPRIATKHSLLIGSLVGIIGGLGIHSIVTPQANPGNWIDIGLWTILSLLGSKIASSYIGRSK